MVGRLKNALLRNNLKPIIKDSKPSSSLEVWSLCVILSALMTEVNVLVNFK